jgi:putative DNA primase/helicase
MPDGTTRRGEIEPDAEAIRAFVGALFRYAAPASFVSLRVFDQADRAGPPRHVEGVLLGDDRDDLVSRAAAVARRAATATKPAFFAAPVCTFTGARTARANDLANGLALSVQLGAGDQAAARRTLESLLGPATMIIATGGPAASPDARELRLQLHWRLAEPTAEAADHARLRQARRMAAALVGGVQAAAAPSHPLRWPGAENREGVPAPATIAAALPSAELELGEALARLAEALEAAGTALPASAPRAPAGRQAPAPAWRDVTDTPPPPPPAGGDLPPLPDGSFELTEDGVALAFADQHRGRLRYCHDAGAWFMWTGTHWRQNRDGLAFTWARDLARRLSSDAAFKTKAITGKAAFAGAVERYAQRDRAFALTAEAWDQDPELLATPEGVLDLRTGELRPAQREDHMTKLTAVAPARRGAACDRWLTFLDQATGRDDELIRFLRQWCGYCLTGSTREHALLFIYGPGGNGKSVFINTVAHILGDYCRAAPMDTFTAAPGDRHPTDLAMLRGARLVTATETEEGRAWAEAKVKQMTGGDPITARFMRQDFFTYAPQFKLTIAGNHKPALKTVDEAARRRFNIVPFLHKPVTPDRYLEQKLREEWPAILRWMVEGCLDWRTHGLARPRIVTEATAEYFEAQDVIGRWLAERCLVDARQKERPGRLLADFQAWARENGEASADNRRLRAALERVPALRYGASRGERWVYGIGLAPAPEGAGVQGGAGSVQ